MTARIERRVREHRDSDKLYPVECPEIERIRRISPAAPASCMPTPVDVEALLVDFVRPERNYRAIGTDQVAHRTPDTGVRWICFLPNPVIDLVDIGRGRRWTDL